MNILSSVWLHPKKTVRYMIENRLLRLSIGLVIASGFFATFMPVVDPQMYGNFELDEALISEPLSFVELLLSGALASVFSLLIMFVAVGFIFLFGKLFKGKGTYWDVFQASALATIPMLVVGIVGFVWAALNIQSFNHIDPTSSMMVIVSILSIVFGIWACVISIGALAEANQYSNWRAFFTLMLPTVIILVIFAALAIFVVSLMI